VTLTLATSTIISAFNSLTLSLALAVLHAATQIERPWRSPAAFACDRS